MNNYGLHKSIIKCISTKVKFQLIQSFKLIFRYLSTKFLFTNQHSMISKYSDSYFVCCCLGRETAKVINSKFEGTSSHNPNVIEKVSSIYTYVIPCLTIFGRLQQKTHVSCVKRPLLCTEWSEYLNGVKVTT